MVSLKQAKPLSLRANFSWTFAGNVVYAASQWGMLIVLARVGNAEMVGQFALGLAVTAPIIMFANLQLRTVQATDAKGEYRFADYFGMRIVTTLLALLVIVTIALAGYQGGTAEVIILIGVSKAFEALSDVIHGLFQQQERMDRIAQSMIIKGPTSLVALAGGVLLTGEVAGGVIGLVLVWGLIFLFYDLCGVRLLIKSPADIRPEWNINRLVRLAWLALPLGFVMLLISLSTNIPRLFVERYLGEAQLGIFAAMAYFMVAGTIVISALGQSASPRLARHYADDNISAYKWLLLRLVGIGVGLGMSGVLSAIIAGEWLLNLLYGPEYAAASNVLVWIMMAASVSYITALLRYAAIAAYIYRLQGLVSGVSTSVTFVLSILFIPSGGLQGAAMALIVGRTIETLLITAMIIWIMNKSNHAKNTVREQ